MVIETHIFAVTFSRVELQQMALSRCLVPKDFTDADVSYEWHFGTLDPHNLTITFTREEQPNGNDQNRSEIP